jgi:hypothetical protein
MFYLFRSSQWKKDRQYNGQKKKDRQYNGQKKKDRQYNGQKKKDRTIMRTEHRGRRSGLHKREVKTYWHACSSRHGELYI